MKEGKRKTMSRRITAIAAVLSVLALGSPLITANANTMAIKYYYLAVDKYGNLDIQGSIADFKKAFELILSMLML